jgi:hypothetical protein
MRSLSSTLLAKQKTNHYTGIVRAAFASISNGQHTYYKNRILSISPHLESPDSYTAQMVLNNADKVFTTLDLTGDRCQISYGMNTVLGDEYSKTAVLWVKSQQNESVEGRLVTTLNLIGIPDLLKLDLADGSYTWSIYDSNTIKDLITQILTPDIFTGGEGNPPAYTSCSPYTVTFDSEDSLIDTFCPRNLFSINDRDSRWDKVNELLRYTKCAMRFGDETNDNIVTPNFNIHIFNPTISGTSYNYSYDLTAGDHKFYLKNYRTRLTIPNFVSVESLDGTYSGYAEDSRSYTQRPVQRKFYLAVTSNDEANAMSAAILQQYQLGSETGSAQVPMNVGQEIWDYVNIVDSREGDDRKGNIQYVSRYWSALQSTMGMSFGFGSDNILKGELATSMTNYLYRVNMEQRFAEANQMGEGYDYRSPQ